MSNEPFFLRHGEEGLPDVAIFLSENHPDK